MYGVASIPVSPPQNAFRECNVRHELTVWGKTDKFGRNASEVGLEPTGLRVIADQFASQDDTMGQKSLSRLCRESGYSSGLGLKSIELARWAPAGTGCGAHQEPIAGSRGEGRYS